MHHSCAIYFHHVQQTLRFHLMHFAVLPESRVVDQQVYAQALFFCERENFQRRLAFGQVRRHHVRLDAVLLPQAVRNFLQPVKTPRGQHQVCASRRKLFCQGHTNPCARTGNQCPLALPLAYHLKLPSGNPQFTPNRPNPFCETAKPNPSVACPALSSDPSIAAPRQTPPPVASNRERLPPSRAPA